MSGGTNNVRDLIRKLRKQGADVRRDGGNHWKVFVDGRVVAILPTHPVADVGRAAKSARSQLRRAGFDV